MPEPFSKMRCPTREEATGASEDAFPRHPWAGPTSGCVPSPRALLGSDPKEPDSRFSFRMSEGGWEKPVARQAFRGPKTPSVMVTSSQPLAGLCLRTGTWGPRTENRTSRAPCLGPQAHGQRRREALAAAHRHSAPTPGFPRHDGQRRGRFSPGGSLEYGRGGRPATGLTSSLRAEHRERLWEPRKPSVRREQLCPARNVRNAARRKITSR